MVVAARAMEVLGSSLGGHQLCKVCPPHQKANIDTASTHPNLHVSKESGKRASNFRTFAKVQVLKHFIGVLGENIYGVKDLFYFQFELNIAWTKVYVSK